MVVVAWSPTAAGARADPFGAQTINGGASRILSAQWETVTLRSDGTNWIAI